MRIQKGDQWNTAFQTRYGHPEYPLMLFSPSNTVASFQSYVNKIVLKELDVFVNIYLDEILIYIKNTGQSHMEAIR